MEIYNCIIKCLFNILIKTVFIILFLFSGFTIAWGMVGYNVSLKILDIVFSKRKLEKDYTKKPFVTVLIVAHNEEKVIEKKIRECYCK